jgi:CRP-like cAMP-binding protein
MLPFPPFVVSRRWSQHLRGSGDAGLFNFGQSWRLDRTGYCPVFYTQGEGADSVMYIQKGGVKLSVVNESGSEAVVAMLARVTFWARDAWRVSRSDVVGE